MLRSLHFRRNWWVASLALRAAPASALGALGWLLRGNRVRGWNQLCKAAAAHREFYHSWTIRVEPAIIDGWLARQTERFDPAIAVLVIGSSLDDAEAMRQSVNAARLAFGQETAIYSHPIQVDGSIKLPKSARQTFADAMRSLIDGNHEWILPLPAGALVAPALGAVLAVTLAPEVNRQIVYWDEDRLKAGARADPWIKPAWDELIFLARDCLSGSAIFSSKAVFAASARLQNFRIEPASLHRLALETVQLVDAPPVHIPLILTYRTENSSTQPLLQRCEDIAKVWQAQVTCQTNEQANDFLVVAPPCPDRWPKVSIIIPTKDRGDLLDACTTSLSKLHYHGEIETIVVDNGTTEAHARAVLDRLAASPGTTIRSAPGPFNFSALNNLAASIATGELLCLLNNDVECIDGNWLEAMVRHAFAEGIGAVGAQLHYPDSTIQHSGVSVGIGGAAGHVERGRSNSDAGFEGWKGVTREVSAVTAACLLIKRDVYLSVGGFDEKCFPVAFNDVDFCLRLKAAGYRNLIVAEARLIHHESLSRGDDTRPFNVARFQSALTNLQERWGTREFVDPHFSPLFSRTSAQCMLAI